MRKTTALIAFIFAVSLACSSAVVYDVALSPGPGLALNLGSNPYSRDHGAGLSGLNEPGMFTGVGSGNTVGAGITFDDVTNLLTFDFAYGSAFGFSDLAGDLISLHFHAPGNVLYPGNPNTNGGVILDLAPFHTASGTKSGRITGSTTLSSTNATNLIDNLLYANIHSTVQSGGEIRGQLILVPEPTTTMLGLCGGAAMFVFRRRR